MNEKKPKSEFQEIKIEGGRTIPLPSNNLKPKVTPKPKDKK